MNNAKMWLVVSPSVGVPIFLGAVAVGSFAVHVAVLSNTSWVADFLSGQALGSGDEQAAALVPNSETTNAAYVVESDGAGQQVTVILSDGTVTTAVLQSDVVLASASEASPPLIAAD